MRNKLPWTIRYRDRDCPPETPWIDSGETFSRREAANERKAHLEKYVEILEYVVVPNRRQT